MLNVFRILRLAGRMASGYRERPTEGTPMAKSKSRSQSRPKAQSKVATKPKTAAPPALTPDTLTPDTLGRIALALERLSPPGHASADFDAADAFI